MFETFIERPVFNLLEVIYALIPGHDLGVAIIVFTIVVRLVLYPIVKKQLHHSLAMRRLRPELQKIKKAAAGDRQKQARMQAELYKEHSIKPFSMIGTTLVQLPIFLALFFSIRKLIHDPNSLQTFSYDWVHDLSWIRHLAENTHNFEHSFLGIVNLAENGVTASGIYVQAVILALIAGFVQYHQSKLLLPDAKDARKLSQILKDTAAGKEADQSEVGEAVSRGMIYFIPVATFAGVLAFPMALGLYVITSSAVGFFQQRHVLGKDVKEMQQITDEKPSAKSVEAESKKKSSSKTKKSKKPSSKKRKRR